jgi:methylphosphonate synthase
MDRAGKPYYQYRDTAMSSAAAFRPEWIQELCIVDDNDSENAAVQWNNGHFLHQFTYFVGPVNFYYQGPDGKKRVAVMNTGDSMYITPFVPHSFATRRNDARQLGHILALTYGAKLGGEPQQELSLLGPELAARCVLDFSSRQRMVGSLVRHYRESLSLSREHLGREISLSEQEVVALEAGQLMPDTHQVQLLAHALRVNARDLLPVDEAETPVLVQRYGDGRRWLYPGAGAASEPSYEIVELCSTRKLPASKAIELNVCRRTSGRSSEILTTALHQYIYNLGPETVTLRWQLGGKDRAARLDPDDSVYIKPGIPHAFDGAGGRLLVLRIGGRIGGDALEELAHIGPRNLGRVLGESIQWFNPEGRQSLGAAPEKEPPRRSD